LEELLQSNLEDVRDAEGDFDRRRAFVNFDADLAGNGVEAIRLVHNAEPYGPEPSAARTLTAND
jgi:hypothetical protein